MSSIVGLVGIVFKQTPARAVMGATDSATLQSTLPLLGNFASGDLGFMS